jgi:predicted transposase YbfD/YdcC
LVNQKKEPRMSRSKRDDPRPPGLVDYLAAVPDPRVDRTREHQLIDILVIGVCCLICGGEGFTDMEIFGLAQREWFRTFLELPGGIPSHDTFNRVFSAIDPRAFMDCFIRWTQTLRARLKGEVVALDGKALRRAHNEDAGLPYVVSAWAAENRLALGQIKVDEKSNEITAIPELLRVLDVAGCIVTIDAMGCQKKIAREIVAQGADYVLSLKGNQGTMQAEVEELFAALPLEKIADGRTVPEAPCDFHQTVDGDHGRIETRRCWCTADVAWFADRDQWKGLASFGMVEAKRETKGKVSRERRYFISSLSGDDAAQFLQATRDHWGIENRLHWTLDVTFREDYARARTKNAAENLAALRRFALNLLKSETSEKKLSIRSKRLMAGWSGDYLKRVLGI